MGWEGHECTRGGAASCSGRLVRVPPPRAPELFGSEQAGEPDGEPIGAGRRAPRPPSQERHAPAAPDAEGARAFFATDWSAPRFIDLFAGIGGIRLGFIGAFGPGARCVFTSEWDEHAQATYEANFGEKPHGDITLVAPSDIPEHDALLAGFPCQPFSIIGDRKGFGDTRGTLFFAIEEILRVRRPPMVLLENVKQFRTHDGGRTYRTVIDALSRLGYFTHSAVLNALRYGVPQRRERTFIVGFRADAPFEFPKGSDRLAPLAGVLEPDGAVDASLWASPRIREKRAARFAAKGVAPPPRPSVWHENKAGDIGAHPYSCALRANASYNYLLINGERRPSSRELLRLQGFPDSFRIVVPHSAIRKQTGNSVAVPVIRAIAEAMARAVRDDAPSDTQRVRVAPALVQTARSRSRL